MRDAHGVRPTEDPQGHRTQSVFRPDIQGLRAVAVLAVVLFHAAVPGFGGGFVGVDVFFVISGFLITGLLWREAKGTGTVRLRSFYGARARRLLPAAAAVGVLTMIGAVILLPVGESRVAMTDGIASALYVSNYWFILRDVSYFNDAGHLPTSPFQHYWSLGVEEQFYLVWPTLILGTAWLIRKLLRRNRSQATSSERPYVVILAAVAATSFALSFVVTYVMPAVAFFSLPTRAWQLAVGGLVALTADRWRRLPPRAAMFMGWAGLALIALACTRLSGTTLYPGIAALLPTLGAALVIGAGTATPDQGCGRLLGTPPMRAIGEISYSWYLWHWPILIFAPLIVGHSLGLAGRLTAAVISAGLAALTLRYLENPLRFAPSVRNSPRRSLALGAVATAIAACTGAALLHAVPIPVGRGAPATPVNITATRPPAGSTIDAYDTAVRDVFAQVRVAVAASADLAAIPSNLSPALRDASAEKKMQSFNGCVRSFFEAGQPECATGDTTSATTVALVGDSHAAMWIPAFEQMATQRRWRLETLAKAGCPSVSVPVTGTVQRIAGSLQKCDEWRAQTLDRLRADKPQLIVVSVWRQYGSDTSRNWQPGFQSYDAAWLASLTRLVRQLRDTGSKVLVLGPVPDPQSVVPICLSGHLDDPMACAPSRSTAVNESGIAAESAATESGGGRYVDLTNLFCTADRCPVIVGSTLVYFDWSHITLEYARLLGPVMGALADRELAHR